MGRVRGYDRGQPDGERRWWSITLYMEGSLSYNLGAEWAD